MRHLDDFQRETRAWLEENCPADMRTPMDPMKEACWGGRHWQFTSEGQKLWLQRMAARGWTVPLWPKEYGGGGLSKPEAKILAQELRRIKARPPLSSFGIWMLGPALLKFGNEAQKKRFLPEIARGDIRWCQGYSEPGAGSDLASLQTKCEDISDASGDYFLVNGQKIWTSYADKSDWIFCLVRTDNSGKKHHGISFLLFDMESPGVSTKPIKLISGNSPFCETFFEDVKVPKDQLIGQRDKGWTIAKYLLTHEREMIGDTGSLKPIAQMVAELGISPDPVMQAKINKISIDEWAFSQTMQRLLAEAKAGASLGAKSSMLKYYGTELNKRRFELMMDMAGHDGLEWEGANSEGGKLARLWLRTKGNSIEGGTSEIQLNIIAKHILHLPGA